ncbi:hypothetical protein Cylst_3443 [Cylindrospermum stagnale PCC 7417]|uniref:Uncharacterized protein n=1 Tax=Cylindrospermum stagnale PCC 7417 TaxID=56107 RepID=K9X1I7_9NOST|nr:hypothetical protein [Cylindrospermum stagnale]AFZ25592.1 hypothetical protein Cylst_3443 [Cylindrospermum stagnale PCC 7417]
MTTAVKGCNNLSNAFVSIVNVENPANSRVVSPGKDDRLYAWISQHKEKPLSVHTKIGRCIIWDSDWKILGQWDNDSSSFVLAELKSSPKDYLLEINSEGRIAVFAL